MAKTIIDLSKQAYVGLGDENKLIVQRSRPLLDIIKQNLSIEEAKITDVFLARINAYNTGLNTVIFEKGELEKLFGVKRIRKENLDKYLFNLLSPITIENGSETRVISLFSEAVMKQSEDGLWQVKLTSNPIADEFIFGIRSLGYLKYSILETSKITSKYSYILFLYLIDNIRRKSWEVSLPEIKARLDCTADCYNEYKYFNNLVLKKCREEINEKTSLRYEYESIKEKRCVIAIRFTILDAGKNILKNLHSELLLNNSCNNASNISDGLIESLSDVNSDSAYNEYKNEAIAFLASACEYEFSETEMEYILSFMSDIQETARKDFLSKLYKKFKVYAEKENMTSKKRRLNYFVKMTKNENNKQ